MAEEGQIVSRGAPADLSTHATVWRGGGEPIPFSRYGLSERIASGPDDECWIARTMGLDGFSRRTFLRRFPRERLAKPTLDALRRQGMLAERGVAQIFELGRIDEWGFLVGEYVDGVSIAELPPQPWLVALALVHDACEVLARVAQKGVDAAITGRRMRLSTSGELVLCMGVPAAETPPWHRAVCDVVRPLLALAATADERARLDELFADDDPDAVWIASDLLVERHPELDPMLPIVFLALAGRASRAEARRLLVERVRVEDLRGLWNAVIDLKRQ